MIASMIVGILFVAYIAWHYVTYNSLVNARVATEQSWSNVEVELKRRLDLLENLVQIVKGYSRHEAETLIGTVAQRNLSASTGNAQAATQSATLIKDTISKLFVLAEAYPDLKASEQFRSLQHEIANTENRIAERRNAYNQTVSICNNACHASPSNLVAYVYDFKDRNFFDISDEESNRQVMVNFA